MNLCTVMRFRVGGRRTAWRATAHMAQWRCYQIEEWKIIKYQKLCCLASEKSFAILPELVVVVVFIMYLEFGRCLLLFSNHVNTSSTACGFFFCSCLLMFELISSRAHASGIPYKQISNIIIFDSIYETIWVSTLIGIHIHSNVMKSVIGSDKYLYFEYRYLLQFN